MDSKKLAHGSFSENRRDTKTERSPGKVAAAAAAILACFAPMTERIAHAEEPHVVVVDAAEQRNARISQPTVIASQDVSELYGETSAGEADDAAPEAGGAAPQPDESAEAPTQPLENAEPTLEPPTDGELEFDVVFEAAEPEPIDGVIFYSNLEGIAATQVQSEYQDMALTPFPDSVDIAGRPRNISLDNDWDLGGNVIGNEAGTAVYGSVRYTDLLRLDGGNVWLGEHAAPFGRFLIRPELNFWRFKLVYYGTLAGVAEMPSYIYSSHSVGTGISIPISLDSSDESRKFTIRGAAVGGGSLSYPAWDDIQFNVTTGLSLQLNGYPSAEFDYLLYGMATFMAAAPDPMKTAYIYYYRPEFQDVEFGFQTRIYDDYTLRAFVELGPLSNRYAFRGTWTVEISDSVEADFWLLLGATQWDDLVGGRWDAAAAVGATVVFGTENGINSTNTSSYEHLQDAAVEYAETDFPERDSGLYGFGDSGNEEYDRPINEAKRRMRESSTFDEFAASYNSDSFDDVLLTARYLGAFLQRFAYDHDALDAFGHGRIFDPAVERIGSAEVEDIFQYMQEYVNWHETNPPGTPLPEYLRNGIAVCSGIHWLMAEFLRANGLNALVISVNTPDMPHVITVVQMCDRTMLLDYGKLYQTGPGTMDEVLRFYGREIGAPTFQAQIFGPDGYVGTYTTSEGRLWHQVIGLDNEQLLRTDFLNVR